MVLTRESQDPVHKLIPSLLTPKQLTRLSCPTNDPTFSARVTSHTCQKLVLGSGENPIQNPSMTYFALKIIITSKQKSA